MFHAAYGLSVMNLRVFMVYGPGQQEQTRLVPSTIASLLAGSPPMISSGSRRFDWVYVDDVVGALVAAGEAATGDDAEPIEIGSGTLTSIRDVVDAIADRIDADVEPQFGALPDRPPEPELAADLGRAAELLGWTPETSLASGLDATIAWHMQRRDARREYSGAEGRRT
jgi:nucleoside-diphosphate-sugar epimerase